MKRFSRIISVFMAIVMMMSLLTFNSAAASITKMEIVSLPTKTTFYHGTDWDYGYWKFPEDDGFGVFTPRDGIISFMHQGGYFSFYQDRGMLDMNGLVVKVTYSDGKTTNIAYKETKHSTGVVTQNMLVSPKGGEYKVGDILRLAEGDLAPVSCLSCNAEKCERAETCPTLPMWTEFHNMVNNYFDGITLADLMK